MALHYIIYKNLGDRDPPISTFKRDDASTTTIIKEAEVIMVSGTVGSQLYYICIDPSLGPLGNSS